MKTALLARAVAWTFALSAVFPPFLQMTPRGQAGCGHGFLFSPPTGRYFEVPCRVDVSLLAMEWLFLAVCMTALHRRQIAKAFQSILAALSRNSDAQIEVAQRNADTHTEAARILAAAIVRHAEEQRVQKSMF